MVDRAAAVVVQVDAAVVAPLDEPQHHPLVVAEAVLVPGRRRGAPEDDGEPPAGHGRDHVQPMVGDDALEAAVEVVLQRLQRVVEVRLAGLPHERQGRQDRHRVGVEGPGVLHRSDRLKEVHDPGVAGERGHRQPSAQRLAHGGDVGGDAVLGLRGQVARLERRLDLVEEQHDAGLGSEFPHALQVRGFRPDRPPVPVHGLQHERGRLLAVALDRLLQGVHVVVRDGDDQARELARDARGLQVRLRAIARQPVGRRMAADVDQLVIAVEVTLDADDPVAAGMSSAGADEVQRRLRSGGAEPHPVRRRHRLAHQPRQLLVVGRLVDGREADPGRGRQRVRDRRMAVAEQCRAVAATQVDEGAAIDIGDAAALGTRDVHGSAERLVDPGGGVDPAGHHLGGGAEVLGDRGAIGDRAGWASGVHGWYRCRVT